VANELTPRTYTLGGCYSLPLGLKATLKSMDTIREILAEYRPPEVYVKNKKLCCYYLRYKLEAEKQAVRLGAGNDTLDDAL
jgi:hypothetical protein